MQTNVLIELGSVVIRDSTFKNGTSSHVKGDDADVELVNVTMYDSIDDKAEGHGLHCVSCGKVIVVYSNF